MSLTERVLSELRNQPPGVPIAIGSLAERLGCSPDELLAAGEELQRREPGDEELVTVVKRISGEDDVEFYVSQVPIALNDETDRS